MSDIPTGTDSMDFEVGRQPLRPGGRTILIVAVLVVVAAAAALILRGTLPSGSTAADGESTLNVMPSNTMMYFSLAAHPDEQPNYNVIAAAWEGSTEANQLESVFELGLLSAGINWEKDVLTWLGDRVAVGVVDFGSFGETADSGDFSSFRTPFIVLAAQTRDRAASDAFLAELRDRLGSNLGAAFTDTEHRGVTITYAEGNSSDQPDFAAHATIEDMVVVSVGGPEQLTQVIDAALDGANLGSSETFNTTMSQLPAPNVGVVYMDYSHYSDAIQSSLGAIFDDPEFQSQFDAMQAFGSMGGTVAYDPVGLRFDAVVDMDYDALGGIFANLSDLGTVSNRVFDAIPASAAMAFNGNANGTYWSDLLNNVEYLELLTSGVPDMTGQDVIEKIEEFETLVGVDLSADLFELLDGEVALALLETGDLSQPSTNAQLSLARLPSIPFEFAMLADASDADRVVDSLTKIMQTLIAELGDQVSLREETLNGAPIHVVGSRDAETILAYGAIDGRLVIGSNPNTLASVDTADQNPLSGDATFQEATAVLPADRAQTGYIHLIPFWDWFNSMTTEFGGECAPCNWLQPMKWMSLSSEAPDLESGITRSTMFIGLEAPQ